MMRVAEKRVIVAEERVMEAEEKANERVSDAGTRIRSAEERVRKGEKRLIEAEERVLEAEVKVATAEGRMRESRTLEDRATREKEEAERRIKEECDKRFQVAEERAIEVEIQVREVRSQCDARVEDAEERMERRVGEVTDHWERRLEKEMEQNRARVLVAEDRAMEAEKRADNIEGQWVVQRNEIHMTEESLGIGSWGEVKIAEFRGIKVAAKLLHKDLQYANIFIREMNMAARLRHPNLVQFVGASRKRIMIILTELMPMNLRHYLKVNTISVVFTTGVSIDVARALNYLHLIQPDPIVHGDISSTNVLLEPVSGDRWRAKVSDYGSANFQQNLQTIGPASPVYSAPEAHTTFLQSPKMDIFSFGVLVETCTARFPEISDSEDMIASITDQRWASLIRRCIHQDKDKRPSAAEILAEFQVWQQ